MNLFLTFGSTPWTGDQPDVRPLPTQDNTEKRGHTSMPRAGFEHTIPVFVRSKAVLSLNRAAIGTGTFHMFMTLLHSYAGTK
jgi:hypothetical protein